MTPPNSTTDGITLKNNPFIWGNIALIASVPWLLALSMAGLAVGDPVFPAWFEISILGFPAIALVTWVQWQQPFSPFSLWFVTQPPESLSDRQRQVLTLIKQNHNGWYTTGWIAIAVAVLLSVIFCKLYGAAPLAQAIAPFPAGLRFFGILWAEVFFLLSNVLLQSGVSALRIKLTDESELTNLQPFASEKVKNSFTNIGWRSPQLLKFFEEEVIENIPEKPISESEPIPIVEDAQEVEVPTDAEELEPLNLVIDPNVEEILEVAPDLDITDTTKEPPIAEANTSETDSSLDIADISLDQQPVAEIEELEISEIVAEQPVVEPDLEVAIIAEPQVDTFLNEEMIQENEELEPIESSIIQPNIEEVLEIETDLDITDITSDTKVEEIEVSEIDSSLEVADVSLGEQIVEDEELEISEIVAEESVADIGLESETSETTLLDSSVLEVTDTSLEEQTVEETEELEISEIVAEESVIETVLDPTDISLGEKIDEEVVKEPEEVSPLEAIADLPVGEIVTKEPVIAVVPSNPLSTNRKAIDFFKKSRKAGNSQKKQGFGKSLIKSNVTLPNEAIAQPVDQEVALADEQTQDFDDELDELIAFNAYVENILQNYLTDADEEIIEVETVEQKDLTETISESIDSATIPDSTLTAIATETQDSEDLLNVQTQVPEVRNEEIATENNDQHSKDPKYLVQEFLVDKFLARLEELNSADKANKANEQVEENSPKPNAEVDEFADLEALLDRKPLTENPE